MDVPEGEKVHVEVYNASGKTVFTKTCSVTRQKTELFFDDMKPGIYVVLAVASNGERFRNKLVIVQ
jgi:uncharacterized protein (DUF2141 family)